MFLRDDHVGRGFVCVGVSFSDNSEKVIKDCVSSRRANNGASCHPSCQ